MVREATATVAAAGAFAVLHAGNEDRQALHVAAVEREFNDAAVFDDGADGGVFRLERNRVGDNFNGFGDAADVEFEILADLRGGFQAQGLHDPGAEARFFTADRIVADGQEGEGVVPGFIGLGGQGDVGAQIGRHHVSGGDGGPRRIDHKSLNRLRS